MASPSTPILLFFSVLVFRSFVAATDPDLRPATMEPQFGLPVNKFLAPRNEFARGYNQSCDSQQYCSNSKCCFISSPSKYSCIPSDGNCCPDGTYCQSGYVCTMGSAGNLICQCQDSTCSGDLSPGNGDAQSSSNIIQSSPSIITRAGPSSTADSIVPTTTINSEAQPQASKESMPQGLSSSDKIALGCGIGIGLPGTIAGIVACIHQISRKRA